MSPKLVLLLLAVGLGKTLKASTRRVDRPARLHDDA